MDVLSGLLVAVGVAAAAGLNAPLPLLLLGALDRWTGLVDLQAPWDALSQPEWLVALAALTALDVVGDKVPAVDHVLHVLGLAAAPLAGALAAMAGSSATELAPVIAAVAGAIVAEGTHVTRAGVRPVSTATTGGAANPVLSVVEDVTSAVLTVLAVVVPVLAVALVVLLGVAAVRLLRRVRGRLRPGAPRSPA
jgi:hypothetical protein